MKFNGYYPNQQVNGNLSYSFRVSIVRDNQYATRVTYSVTGSGYSMGSNSNAVVGSSGATIATGTASTSILATNRSAAQPERFIYDEDSATPPNVQGIQVFAYDETASGNGYLKYTSSNMTRAVLDDGKITHGFTYHQSPDNHTYITINMGGKIGTADFEAFADLYLEVEQF